MGEYTYRYPRPMVTVDVLLRWQNGRHSAILLIERAHDPFRGAWALPGGYLDAHEGLAAAAARELHEETGLRDIDLRQLGAFGDPGRDPRGHTVTVVYGAIVTAAAAPSLHPGDDARNARWFPTDKLPSLAFDHQHIISTCLPRLAAP